MLIRHTRCENDEILFVLLSSYKYVKVLRL